MISSDIVYDIQINGACGELTMKFFCTQKNRLKRLKPLDLFFTVLFSYQNYFSVSKHFPVTLILMTY